MAATHRTPPEQRFSVVVHSVAWDDRLDELAALLAGRFGRSAALLTAGLHRGRAAVAGELSIHEVSAVIEELARLGITAEAELETAPAPPAAGTMHVGWARAVAQVEGAPTAGTMIGMPAGMSDHSDASSHDPPASDAEPPEIVRSRAAAIRAAMASSPRQDTMDHGTAPAPESVAGESETEEATGTVATASDLTSAEQMSPSGGGLTIGLAASPPLVATPPPPVAAPIRPSGEPSLTAVQPAASANTLISEEERVAAVRGLVPPTASGPSSGPQRAAPELSALPAAALAAAARSAAASVGARPADPAAPKPNAWGQVLGEVVRGPAARPSAQTSPLEAAASGMTVAAAPGPLAAAPLDAAFAGLRAEAPAAAEPRPAFERLRSPEPAAARDSGATSSVPARAWRAAALSVLAPGAGQSYNGQPSRAVTFALAGLLVIPWAVSVYDAFKVANRQAERGIQIRSNPRRVVGAVGGFWVLVLALYTLFAVAGRALKPDLSDVPTSLPPAVAAPRPTVVPNSPEDLQAAHEREQAEQNALDERFAGLVARARIACDQGRYDECRSLAEQALAINESSPEAQRVHVEAVVGQSGTGPDLEPEPSSDPDGREPTGAHPDHDSPPGYVNEGTP